MTLAYIFNAIQPWLAKNAKIWQILFLEHLQFWVDCLHIGHKWSLVWEGVLRIMTFELDQCFQGQAAMNLQKKTAKIWHIFSCWLYSMCSSGWIISVLGTNDDWHETMCHAYWPLTLTYILQVSLLWHCNKTAKIWHIFPCNCIFQIQSSWFRH